MSGVLRHVGSQSHDGAYELGEHASVAGLSPPNPAGGLPLRSRTRRLILLHNCPQGRNMTADVAWGTMPPAPYGLWSWRSRNLWMNPSGTK